MSVLCNYFLSSPPSKPVVELAALHSSFTLDRGLCSAVPNTLPAAFPTMENNGNDTSIDFPKYQENR